MGTNLSQFKLHTLLLASSLAISGCVSSDISSDISSNEVSSEQASLTSDQTNDVVAANQSVEALPTKGIPIPSTAPRSELALNSETQPNNQPAVQQVTELATASAANTGEAPTSVAVAEKSTPSALNSTTQEQATQIASTEKTATERKPTFFELLRKKAEERKAAEALAKQTQQEKIRVARLQAKARKQSSTDALPGVKKGHKLFGIDESKTDVEAKVDRKVASVGGFVRSNVVNGLILQTSSVQVKCFKPELMRVLKVVERHYGRKVMVTSGYRSPARNRRAGGVKNSAHVYCKAADIQVRGVSKWNLAKYLRTIPGRGGVGTYCRTNSVHIDVGSQRDWHHPCRRTKRKKRRT